MTYDLAAIDQMRRSFEPQIIFRQGEAGFQEMEIVQDGLRVILRLRSQVFSVDYHGASPKVLVEQALPLHDFRKLVTVLRDTLKKIDATLAAPLPSGSPSPQRPPEKIKAKKLRRSRG